TSSSSDASGAASSAPRPAGAERGPTSKPSPSLRRGTAAASPRCCDGSIASSTASTRPSDRATNGLIDAADAPRSGASAGRKYDGWETGEPDPAPTKWRKRKKRDG